MKVYLTSNKDFIRNNTDITIEAGLADNISHFDHHGTHGNYPSPCNNERMNYLTMNGGTDMNGYPNANITITHMDMDTFVGLLRACMPHKLPNLDFSLLEQIDLYGNSAADNNSLELQYKVGISEYVISSRFPRVTDDVTDVTDLVSTMLDIPTEEYIKMGKTSLEKSEKIYKDRLVKSNGWSGLWILQDGDNMDVSRPYKDGYNIVVVYRPNFKTISIYAEPSIDIDLTGQEFEGIVFNGQPMAVGSPRGMVCTPEQAIKVWENITALFVSNNTCEICDGKGWYYGNDGIDTRTCICKK